MRLTESVCFACFHPLSSQPALCQFKEHNGLRFVDLEKDGRMDVDADEDDTRIVSGTVVRITVLAKPRFPVRLVQLLNFSAVSRYAREPPIARRPLVVSEASGATYSNAQRRRPLTIVSAWRLNLRTTSFWRSFLPSSSSSPSEASFR
jgi:hypothetical protein